MRQYIVQVNLVVTDEAGWSHTVQLPTFYLPTDMLGIVSEEHAQQIAREIVDPLHKENYVIIVTAIAV